MPSDIFPPTTQNRMAPLGSDSDSIWALYLARTLSTSSAAFGSPNTTFFWPIWPKIPRRDHSADTSSAYL